MKDMFDCLEASCQKELVFLIKTRRNKKVRKNNVNTFLYLSEINSDGSLKFTRGLITAMNLKYNYYYDHIKDTVRSEKIPCEIYIMSKLQYYQLIPKEFKPVCQDTWWNRIKVWFSRKVQYFAGYISIERLMKDKKE